MITAVIINTQKQDREKIVSLLKADREIKVLASGKDGYDAIKLISSLKPDIAILDNYLESSKGEEISPVLKIHSPLTAVVILVARINDYQLFRAASNGISGFVDKEADIGTLPLIVRCISMGGCFISPTLTPSVLRLLSKMNPENPGKHDLDKSSSKNQTANNKSVLTGENPTRTLSRMEVRVLAYIGLGLTSSEIARRLDITVGTVRNYVSAVMRKTGLRNRSQIARYAFCCGIVPLSPE